MIKHALCVLVLLAAASIAAAQPTPTQSPSPAPAKTPTPAAPHTNLKVGQAAPDFTLPSDISGPDGRKVKYKLSDFKGKKNVVLAFYVFAFTGG
jgi:cytochrome oxidase Cu insertion factor (SCO1/SenC/PrrC family)